MEFHIMKRKELQALCKKHGIPANRTNLEMANQLTLLYKEKEKERQLESDLSCLKNSGEITDGNDTKVAKTVRFCPEKESMEDINVKAAPNMQRAARATRRTMMERVVEKADPIIENGGGSKPSEHIIDGPVGRTRSRARKLILGSAVLAGSKLTPVDRKKARGIDRANPIDELSDHLASENAGIREIRHPVIKSYGNMKVMEELKGATLEGGKVSRHSKPRKKGKEAVNLNVISEKDIKLRRPTHSCSQITRENAPAVETEAGMQNSNKVEEEHELVLALEKPLRRSVRNAIKQKCEVLKQGEVGTDVSMVECKTRKRLREHPKGMTVAPLRRSVRNANKQKSELLRKEEVRDDVSMLEDEKRKQARGLILDEKLTVVAGNRPLRRSRSSTSMLISIDPTEGKISICETTGSNESHNQLSASFLDEEGAGVEKPLKRPRRNASTENLSQGDELSPMESNDQLDCSGDMGKEKERKENLLRGELKTPKGSTVADNAAVNDRSSNVKGGSEKFARVINDFHYCDRDRTNSKISEDVDEAEHSKGAVVNRKMVAESHLQKPNAVSEIILLKCRDSLCSDKTNTVSKAKDMDLQDNIEKETFSLEINVVAGIKHEADIVSGGPTIQYQKDFGEGRHTTTFGIPVGTERRLTFEERFSEKVEIFGDGDHLREVTEETNMVDRIKYEEVGGEFRINNEKDLGEGRNATLFEFPVGKELPTALEEIDADKAEICGERNDVHEVIEEAKMIDGPELEEEKVSGGFRIYNDDDLGEGVNKIVFEIPVGTELPISLGERGSEIEICGERNEIDEVVDDFNPADGMKYEDEKVSGGLWINNKKDSGERRNTTEFEIPVGKELPITLEQRYVEKVEICGERNEVHEFIKESAKVDGAKHEVKEVGGGFQLNNQKDLMEGRRRNVFEILVGTEVSITLEERDAKKAETCGERNEVLGVTKNSNVTPGNDVFDEDTAKNTKLFGSQWQDNRHKLGGVDNLLHEIESLGMEQGPNEASGEEKIVAEGIETESMPQSAAETDIYHEVSTQKPHDECVSERTLKVKATLDTHGTMVFLENGVKNLIIKEKLGSPSTETNSPIISSAHHKEEVISESIILGELVSSNGGATDGKANASVEEADNNLLEDFGDKLEEDGAENMKDFDCDDQLDQIYETGTAAGYEDYTAHDKGLGGLKTIGENITGEERWTNVLEMNKVLESQILSEEKLCYVAENREEATGMHESNTNCNGLPAKMAVYHTAETNILEISQFSGGLAPECKAPGVTNEEMPAYNLNLSTAIVAHEQDELNPVERQDVSLDQSSCFGVDDSAYEDFDVVEEKVTVSSGSMKCGDERNEVVCRTEISIEQLRQKILGFCSTRRREEVQCTFDGSGVMGEMEKSNSKSVLKNSCDNGKQVIEMKGSAEIVVDVPFEEGHAVNMGKCDDEDVDGYSDGDHSAFIVEEENTKFLLGIEQEDENEEFNERTVRIMGQTKYDNEHKKTSINSLGGTVQEGIELPEEELPFSGKLASEMLTFPVEEAGSNCKNMKNIFMEVKNEQVVENMYKIEIAPSDELISLDGKAIDGEENTKQLEEKSYFEDSNFFGTKDAEEKESIAGYQIDSRVLLDNSFGESGYAEETFWTLLQPDEKTNDLDNRKGERVMRLHSSDESILPGEEVAVGKENVGTEWNVNFEEMDMAQDFVDCLQKEIADGMNNRDHDEALNQLCKYTEGEVDGDEVAFMGVETGCTNRGHGVEGNKMSEEDMGNSPLVRDTSFKKEEVQNESSRGYSCNGCDAPIVSRIAASVSEEISLLSRECKKHVEEPNTRVFNSISTTATENDLVEANQDLVNTQQFLEVEVAEFSGTHLAISNEQDTSSKNVVIGAMDINAHTVTNVPTNDVANVEAHILSRKKSNSSFMWGKNITGSLSQTPKKPFKTVDMKENEPFTKREHMGNLTVVKSAFRRPLEDLPKN